MLAAPEGMRRTGSVKGQGATPCVSISSLASLSPVSLPHPLTAPLGYRNSPASVTMNCSKDGLPSGNSCCCRCFAAGSAVAHASSRASCIDRLTSAVDLPSCCATRQITGSAQPSAPPEADRWGPGGGSLRRPGLTGTHAPAAPGRRGKLVGTTAGLHQAAPPSAPTGDPGEPGSQAAPEGQGGDFRPTAKILPGALLPGRAERTAERSTSNYGGEREGGTPSPCV